MQKFEPQTQDQKRLIDWFLTQIESDKQLFTIDGSSGSGKTSSVCYLISLLKLSNCSVGVAAPTNKALRILSDKLVRFGFQVDSDLLNLKKQTSVVNVGTVHRFLNARITSDQQADDLTQLLDQVSFEFDTKDTPLSLFDFVFVDECSMITDSMFEIIKSSITTKTKIFFIGDPFQLFPIQENLRVSKTFDPSFCDVFRLREVVRYSGQLLKTAKTLVETMETGLMVKPYSFPNYNTDDLIVYRNQDGYEKSEWFEKLLELTEKGSKQGDPDYVRALVYKRKTRANLNEKIRSELYGSDSSKGYILGEWLFTHSACSQYIPIDLTAEYYRKKDYGLSTDFVKSKIDSYRGNIGNAWDLRVTGCDFQKVLLPCPTDDLDDFWPKLTQEFCLVHTYDQLGFDHTVAVLTQSQIENFVFNYRKIKKLLHDQDFESKTVNSYLRSLEACFNLGSDYKKFIAQNDMKKAISTRKGNKTTKRLLFSKIQPGTSIVVHQAQGSTIPNTFVLYSDFFSRHQDQDDYSRLETLYRLTYTAITRSNHCSHIFSKY